MRFYVDSIFNREFPDTKPIKKREVNLKIDGCEFTVIIKPESSIKRAFEKSAYCPKYDMYEAYSNYISRSEVIERDDPNLHVEAFHYRPEVSNEVKDLSKEETEKRLNFIINAYRMLEDDAVVEDILRFAEKKKNGTLYKKRYTRIISSAIVSNDFYTFCIFGYAKSDTEFEIKGDWIDDEKNIGNEDKDFLALNPQYIDSTQQIGSKTLENDKKVVGFQSCTISYNHKEKERVCYKLKLRNENGENINRKMH